MNNKTLNPNTHTGYIPITESIPTVIIYNNFVNETTSCNVDYSTLKEWMLACKPFNVVFFSGGVIDGGRFCEASINHMISCTFVNTDAFYEGSNDEYISFTAIGFTVSSDDGEQDTYNSWRIAYFPDNTFKFGDDQNSGDTSGEPS